MIHESRSISDSETFDVSPEQRRLWTCAGQHTDAYLVRCAVVVDRVLEPAAIAEAVRRAVRRHEILRTIVSHEGGPSTPVQIVREAADVRIATIAPQAASALLTSRDYSSLLASGGGSTVTPDVAPFAIGMASLDGARTLIAAHASAFLCDGRGLRLLISEIAALAANPAHELTPDVLQYADVAGWLNGLLSAEQPAAGHEFWQQRLSGALVEGALAIPGRTASSSGAFEPAFIERRVDLSRESLQKVTDAHGVTVESWLLACWLAVLTRFGAPPEICLGVARDCRHRPGLELVPGPLTRSIPVGVPVDAQDTVTAAASRFAQSLISAADWIEWFDWPAAAAPGDAPSNCSFCFEMQDPAEFDPLPQLRCVVADQRAVTEPFAIKLACRPSADRLDVTLMWDDGRYDVSATAPIVAAFDALLTDAIARPAAAAHDLAVLDAAETRRVLVEWSATSASASRPPADAQAPPLVHEAIARRATERPDAVAIVSGSDHVSYGELIARASQVAHHLEELGVSDGMSIGLCVERSPELVIGMIAILLAGGAYVPLDPESPPDRLASMADDAGLPVVVTTKRVTGRLPSRWWQVVDLEADWPEIARHPHVFARAAVDARHIAYVIYTSGSTGRPKGVAIPHRALTNHMEWMRGEFPLTPAARIFQKTSGEFDASVWEFHAPLMAGACLVFARPGGQKDMAYLAETIVRETISVAQFVPSVLRLLLDEPSLAHARALGTVFVGGEALTPALLRACGERLSAEVVNLYGPTEATIDASFWRCTRDAMTVPIGRPVSNTVMYVLDRHGHPAPAGVPGELFIGGRGLAQGYVGQPALTAGRFVPNPFSVEPSARLYRTGDRARWLTDGTLEYLGRLDHQVKVRGHRIELGEIEAVLESHDAVRACAAAVRQGQAGDQQLMAYAVPDAGAAPAVRRWLRIEEEGARDRHETCELPNGMTVAHQNRNETDFLYEEHFVAGSYIRHGITLRDHDCVIDIGANIGMFSMFVARVTRGARLYAFEPVPPTAALLRLNLAAHSPGARVFECGVAGHTGREIFTYYPHLTLMSSRLADAEADRDIVRTFELTRTGDDGARQAIEEILDERLGTVSFECAVRSLGDIIDAERIARIDLLKIDAERSELDVLSGLRDEDWPKVQQLVAEVEDREGRLDAIVGMLESRGFGVITEQEEALHGTALWNVFAARPGLQRQGVATTMARERDLSWMGPAAFAGELREYARRALPSSMAPARIVLLDRLPVLSNGKVDRAMLPAPPDETVYEGPRTSDERVLAQIWGAVLHLERVGRRDDFFILGGHSLLATQVMTRIRQTFGVDLPLRALFELPTIAGLAERLAAARQSAAAPALPPPAPVPRTQPLPLSHQQQRLWFLDRWTPGQSAYNVPYAMRLGGMLDLRAVAQGFTTIAARHEVLRTSFPSVAGNAVQVIHAPAPVPLPLVDLQALGRHAAGVAQRLAALEVRRPFDLSRGPVLRVRALRIESAAHVLIVVVQHIASDAWSVGIMFRELAEAYRAAREKRMPSLPPLRLQYADFAQWQRTSLHGLVLDEQLAYWQEQLADLPVLDLRTDTRPRSGDRRAESFEFRVDSAIAGRLTALGRDANVTLFTILTAALQVLLARHTGQRDFAIGTTVANRRHTDVEPLIGCFVNTLVLRAGLAGGPSFRELIARVHDTALEAYAHQDVPFERLVEKCWDRREAPHTPLFQVMCTLHTEADTPPPLPGATVEAVDIGSGGEAKFDLIATFTVRKGTIEVRLEYALECLSRGAARALGNRFQQLLASFADDASQSIWTAQLATAREAELLAQWSGGDVVTAADARAEVETDAEPAGEPDDIAAAFERQASTRPDAIALVFEEQQVSYGELRRRARALAAALLARGVTPESAIGIDLPRSVHMIVAILGTLQAGAAYLGLDASAPSERLEQMISETRSPIVVSHHGLDQALRGHGVERCYLDDATYDADDRGGPVTDSGRPAGPHRLASVMYTSGSSGTPKGSGITHGAVLSRTLHPDFAAFGPDDVMLQFAPLAFDASTLEIWGALLHGCRLVLAAAAPSALDGLGELMRDEQVTAAWLTASLFHQMVDLDVTSLRGLRQLFTGGEVVSPEHAARAMGALPACTIVNGYGPTENTVFTSCHRISRADVDAGALPIGRPLAATRAYVVEAGGMLAPPLASGELWAGGPGLARGYIGQPGLTASRFVPDAFGGEPGARLYRTADRVRWRGDGVLEFVGRLDDQVKLRGRRIELGEIDIVLGEQPGVRHAAVILREDTPGEPLLVAYVVADPDRRDAKAWRHALAARLPAYMIPAAFVVLDAWPVNRNGKLDRRMLPAPSERDVPGDEARMSPVEEICAGIMAHVLGRKSVGRDDNFFELGGHSLLATRVVARVRAAFDVDLPLRDLFHAPTVAALAARVRDARGASGMPYRAIAARPRVGPMPLSLAQQRLWFLDRLSPGDPAYNVAYAMRLTGSLNHSALAGALTTVVARHEVLRTRFPLETDEGVQVVDQPAPVDVPLIGLEAFGAAIAERVARRLARAEAQRRFDLRTGPLLRVRLLRLGSDSHVVLLTLHHIVSDGWSIELLVHELAEAYAARVASRTPRLPNLPIQYGDFAQWQRDLLEGRALDAQLAYWRRHLADLPVLELPGGCAGAGATRGVHEDAVEPLSIPAPVAAALRARSREASATLFMTLFAAFQVMLARFSGQRDFGVGTVIANRPHADVEPLIGFFVNTLVLRATLDDDPTFDELLERVRETALDAYAHQDVPFERVADALRPGRASQHSPLIRTLLVLQSLATPAPRMPHVRMDTFAPPPPAAKWDFALYLAEAPGETTGESNEEMSGENTGAIIGMAYYRADLVPPAAVRSMLGAYVALLTHVAEDWSCRVFDVPLGESATTAQDVEAFRTQLDLV